MQARRRFLTLCLVALFVWIVYVLLPRPTRLGPNALAADGDDQDASDLPSFMANWKPSSEVGRPPAVNAYKARQQVPFRTPYRKTNKNCRFYVQRDVLLL